MEIGRVVNVTMQDVFFFFWKRLVEVTRVTSAASVIDVFSPAVFILTLTAIHLRHTLCAMFFLKSSGLLVVTQPVYVPILLLLQSLGSTTDRPIVGFLPFRFQSCHNIIRSGSSIKFLFNTNLR